MKSREQREECFEEIKIHPLEKDGCPLSKWKELSPTIFYLLHMDVFPHNFQQHEGKREKRETGRKGRFQSIDCHSLSLLSLHDQIYFLKRSLEKLLACA